LGGTPALVGVLPQADVAAAKDHPLESQNAWLEKSAVSSGFKGCGDSGKEMERLNSDTLAALSAAPSGAVHDQPTLPKLHRIERPPCLENPNPIIGTKAHNRRTPSLLNQISLRLAAMRGRLVACGRLSIGLSQLSLHRKEAD